MKILAERIENRTIKNEKYPIPHIFQLMASCFEVQDLLQRKVDSVENYGVLELKEHLFLREEDLYTGIEDFLHFFLRCATKTHAEGVVESMGNYVEMHSDKRRGLDIGDVGLEARIHWNGPPIHHATRLGESALDQHFGGRRRWHFVTKNNRLESLVNKRLKKEKPRLPFY